MAKNKPSRIARARATTKEIKGLVNETAALAVAVALAAPVWAGAVETVVHEVAHIVRVVLN